MRQVIVKSGVGNVVNVPVVRPGDNEVLVSNVCSFVSVGTEKSSIKNTTKPLWKRALENPSEVRKVFETVNKIGLKNTNAIVKGRLAEGNAVGYSSAGIVIETGKNIKSVKVGDRVACAGAGFAMHAQIVKVPENLVTVMPASLDFKKASTVALGSIALNAVRRSDVCQGEIVCVIGLGLLGNLITQLLSNNGCRVVAVDPDETKFDFLANTRNVTMFSSFGEAKDYISLITGNFGADVTIIAAATKDSSITTQAFDVTRKKGKVIVVGDIDMNLRRKDFYLKEIDFLIASSYGPGRYDKKYELEGEDYPYSFVRWTQRRNMKLYLELLASNEIDVTPFTTHLIDVENASEAYKNLENDKNINSIVFDYTKINKNTLPAEVIRRPKIPQNKVNNFVNSNKLGIIGAGSFCQGMHLPNLSRIKDKMEIYAIGSTTSHKAASIAQQYNASYSTTNFQKIINDDNIGSVLISTRHNTHFDLAKSAIDQGKNVFVEKPITIFKEDLAYLKNNQHLFEKNVFMVGYNRRFSDCISFLKKNISTRKSPMVMNYIVNAGFIDNQHWIHGAEGGGRNLGEVCHMLDTLRYVTDSEFLSVTAHSMGNVSPKYLWNDNFCATLGFKDGSVCNLSYTSMGTSSCPKESIILHVDGKIIEINDFHLIRIHAGNNTKEFRFKGKGHFEELSAFSDAIILNKPSPIALSEIIEVTEVSFIIEEQIRDYQAPKYIF